MAADGRAYYKEYNRRNKLRLKAKSIFGYVEPLPNKKTEQEIIEEEKMMMEIRMKRVMAFICSQYLLISNES